MADAMANIPVLAVLVSTSDAPLTVTLDKEFDLFATDVGETVTGCAIKSTQSVGTVRRRGCSATITPLYTAEQLETDNSLLYFVI
jgi:hypothetical protein